jgi:glycosyltransferase involved in cell wall biosynthesis
MGRTASRARPRVLIWVPIPYGVSGGVQQYVAGMAEGFRATQDSLVRRAWLVNEQAKSWLTELLPSEDDVLVSHAASSGLQSKLAGKGIGRALSQYVAVSTAPAPKEVSRWNPDLVHFPTQSAFSTTLPFVYQPHDLQHHHYPEHFAKRRERSRRRLWDSWTIHATRVAVGSRYTAVDVHERLGIPLQRVDIIRYGIPNAGPGKIYSSMPETSKKSTFTNPYIVYPAAAWPHKNHIGLLRAVALLRDRGLHVNLILTGANAGSVDLVGLVASFELQDQVEILGYLDADEYDEMLSCASGMIVPTLFENASFPVWEAFSHSIPVAASNVCGIPEQSSGAALLFDPLDTEAIANAITVLLSDSQQRNTLVIRGKKVAAELSWINTASDLERCYLRASGH